MTGRGVFRELKRLYRDVNILALDYDASLSSVNRLNRLKLLMSFSEGAESQIFKRK